MCAFKTYINNSIFEKVLLEIEKIVKIFSIFNKFFSKLIYYSLPKGTVVLHSGPHKLPTLSFREVINYNKENNGTVNGKSKNNTNHKQCLYPNIYIQVPYSSTTCETKFHSRT